MPESDYLYMVDFNLPRSETWETHLDSSGRLWSVLYRVVDEGPVLGTVTKLDARTEDVVAEQPLRGKWLTQMIEDTSDEDWVAGKEYPPYPSEDSSWYLNSN